MDQDYKFSMKISYYHSLASGVWLYQHQLDNIFDKMINRFFQRIAYFRTKYYFFFLFPLDRKIYSYFQIRIYRRNLIEKNGKREYLHSGAKMKICAAIACRVQSQRLFGKPLQMIEDKTILGHLIFQLKSCNSIDAIVLAIASGCGNEVFVDLSRKKTWIMYLEICIMLRNV